MTEHLCLCHSCGQPKRSSWILALPGPAVATAAIWGEKQQMEDSLTLPVNQVKLKKNAGFSLQLTELVIHISVLEH